MPGKGQWPEGRYLVANHGMILVSYRESPARACHLTNSRRSKYVLMDGLEANTGM